MTAITKSKQVVKRGGRAVMAKPWKYLLKDTEIGDSIRKIITKSGGVTVCIGGRVSRL